MPPNNQIISIKLNVHQNKPQLRKVFTQKEETQESV